MCDGFITGEVLATEADEVTLGLMMTKTDAMNSNSGEEVRHQSEQAKVSA